MHVFKLLRGKEKPILQRHPWIYKGAIESMTGEPQAGETVKIVSHQGEFLGWGAYSPSSQIAVRMWSFDPQDEIGGDFFHRRLNRAFNLRKEMFPMGEQNACRLVYAESDGLPGFIADRYGNFLVVQILTTGAEKWREALIHELIEVSGIENVYERSDVDVRTLEGLPERRGVICGDEPPDLIQIEEEGLLFLVDIKSGQKTGFYLDQRENRLLVRKFAAGKRVLDVFCYTGGFTLNELWAGASQVLALDASEDALRIAELNLSANGMQAREVSWRSGNAFEILRKLRDQGSKFDMVILDPPKFAPTSAQVHKAARGYKDINLLAFKLLRDDGLLVTFSCSGGIDEALFQKIIADAALDARVEGEVIKRLGQSADHPIALNFPESAYLKGLVVRVRR